MMQGTATVMMGVFLTCLGLAVVPRPAVGGDAVGSDVTAKVSVAEYARQLEGIIASVTDFESGDLEETLMASSLFKGWYQNPEPISAAAEAYITKDPRLPQPKAIAAIASLQCLDLREYLSLVERLAKAPKGAVSEWALFHSVVPGTDFSTRLYRSYRDKDVRRTLELAAASPNANSLLQDAVRVMLDGSALRTLGKSSWTCGRKGPKASPKASP